MFRKVLRRAGLALVVAAVGFGLTATPAVAEERSVEFEMSEAVPTPEGVDQADWFTVLEDAEAEYGDGDKAYLEALKTISPFAVVYCDMQGSWTPGNGYTYRFPARSGYGSACVMESGLNSGAVTVLQRSLNICYGRSLVVDGSFGLSTHNALMYAQSVHGIGVDGVWGPVTRKTVKLASTNGASCRAYPGF